LNPLLAFDSVLFSSVVQTKVGLRLVIASVELIFLALLLQAVIAIFRRRSPRLWSCCWGLVLLKPILTLAIGSPFVVASFEISPEPVMPTTLSGPETLAESQQRPTFYVEDGYDEYALGSSRKAWLRIPLRQDWFLAVLTLGWIAGICWGGIHWTLAGYRLKCIIARAEEPEERTFRIFEKEVAEGDRQRPPQLLVSTEIESPVLFGAYKPVVVLPAWLEEREEEVLANLFRHELTHRRHRDPLLLAIAQLCLVLFFFHPVAHWAYRQWLLYAELACDRAIVDSEEGARDYARHLFSVLEGMQVRQAALSGLYATRHQIGTRIGALMENPMTIPSGLNSSARLAISAFALSLVLFGFGVETVHVSDRDDGLFIGTNEDK